MARRSNNPRTAAIRAAVLLVGLAACSSHYVSRAETAYRDGRYLEVAEDLGRREKEVGQLSTRDRAHYGMYLGLSLIRLGDFPGAEQWLSFSYEVERSQPGTLGPTQRRLLDQGWELVQAVLRHDAAEQAPPPPPGP